MSKRMTGADKMIVSLDRIIGETQRSLATIYDKPGSVINTRVSKDCFSALMTIEKKARVLRIQLLSEVADDE